MLQPEGCCLGLAPAPGLAHKLQQAPFPTPSSQEPCLAVGATGTEASVFCLLSGFLPNSESVLNQCFRGGLENLGNKRSPRVTLPHTQQLAAHVAFHSSSAANGRVQESLKTPDSNSKSKERLFCRNYQHTKVNHSSKWATLQGLVNSLLCRTRGIFQKG